MHAISLSSGPKASNVYLRGMAIETTRTKRSGGGRNPLKHRECYALRTQDMEKILNHMLRGFKQ